MKWKIIYSDLFWDQLLSCWAWSTVTFEGKGLTYSPLVSYVFSVLHTDSTHQYFYFYKMTSERWQHSCKYIYPAQINNCKLVLLAQRTSAHLVEFRVFRRQHSVSSVFFFFYLVWWHLTLILETPRYRPDHITPTALLSGSCVSYWVGAHAWSRTSLKVSLAFLPKCVYITLARTVCRRNRTVPFEISNIAVT